MKKRLFSTIVAVAIITASLLVIGYAEEMKAANSNLLLRSQKAAEENLTAFHSLENIQVATKNKNHVVLKENGTVWVYGSDSNIALHDGMAIPNDVPRQVMGLADVCAVAAGGDYSAALKQDGTVWAWGSNAKGQLGDGTLTDSNTPVMVGGLDDVKAISAGNEYMAALKQDGTVWLWGANEKGQLGDGTTTGRSTPAMVSGLTDVKIISAGREHMAVLKEDGMVFTWGSNDSGELGDETGESRSTPAAISGLAGVTDLEAGDYNTTALKADGGIYTCGDYFYEAEEVETTPEQPVAAANMAAEGISEEPEYMIQGIIDLSGGMDEPDSDAYVQTGALVQFVRRSDQKKVQATSQNDRKNGVFVVKLAEGIWDMKVTKRGYLNYEVTGYEVAPGINGFFGTPQGGTATAPKPIVPLCGDSSGDGEYITLGDMGIIANGFLTTSSYMGRWKADVNNDSIVRTSDMDYGQYSYGGRRTSITYAKFSQDWAGI
jgi:hypothetical protein